MKFKKQKVFVALLVFTFLVSLTLSFLQINLIPSVKASSTLWENYIEGADATFTLKGDYWAAQTFTVGAVNHSVTSVKLEMQGLGEPVTVTVSIKKTDEEGHPTNSDLTYGTRNDIAVKAWYEFTLTEYNLSSNTKYAIVGRAPDGDSLNNVKWSIDWTTATYGGGWHCYSGDGGDSWGGYEYENEDMMFEVWGNAEEEPPPPPPPPPYEPDTSLMQYLYEGDFIGFIVACYTSRIGQGFYGIVMLMLFGIIYNRTKSLALCGVIWLLAGTALIVTMPIISPLVVIFITLGLAGIIYDVIEARNR